MLKLRLFSLILLYSKLTVIYEYLGWRIKLYFLGNDIALKLTSGVLIIVLTFPTKPLIVILDSTTLIFKFFHSTLNLVLSISIDSPLNNFKKDL